MFNFIKNFFYKDDYKFTSENVPIIIPASNRPQFLSRCLDFLTFSEGIRDFTIHFCLDSKSMAMHKENLLLCRNWSLTKKEIYERSGLKNGVCNSTGSIKFILDKFPDCKGYIYIEEDVIVGKNFLNFSLDSLNYYKNNPYVYSVSGFLRSESKVHQVGMKPYIPSMIGHCGWRNRLDWAFERFDTFVKDNRFLRNEMKGMKYPRKTEATKSQVNEHGYPTNNAGAGLLLANQMFDGRLSLCSRPSLCDHIGWYGWHFRNGGCKAYSSIVPTMAMRTHVHAPTFNPYNEYKLITVDKQTMSDYLKVDIKNIQDPTPLQ